MNDDTRPSRLLGMSGPPSQRQRSWKNAIVLITTVFLLLTALPALPPAQASAGPPAQPDTVQTRTRTTTDDDVQLRVMRAGQPVTNALVYRLAADQEVGGTLLRDENGQPCRSDEQGYLHGHAPLAVGDKVFAVVPIAWTESYTLYHTSGVPTEIGIETVNIVGDGIQTLAVSADHPLILFNLAVSLEWDASNDPTYLQQLEFNLQRTSQYLYDFSNGQVALGEITVSQNADDWAYSHIVVHASNSLRPFSDQGGIVITPTVDPQHPSIVYDIGQVSMGATWNRYGDPGHNLGDDWPLILAHELGHYLFFHDETYLGLDPEGFLIAVDSCVGSAMGDPYTDMRNTEFIADDTYWNANCAATLANQTLARNEWETMRLWYPALQAPAEINPGPSIMPFNLTSIRTYDPITPTEALEDPTFYLDYTDQIVGSSEARAYIVRDDYVVDVGSPIGGQNRLLARGAQPGDQVCVFDRGRRQYGCEVVTLGDDRINLERDTTWKPVVQISPVTSTTLNIRVEGLPTGLPLRARLYPEYGKGEAPISLTTASGAYVGTFHLSDVAMGGNIRVWVEEPVTETNPRREALVSYMIGGNPGARRRSSGELRGGGGARRRSSGDVRSGARRRSNGGQRTRQGSVLSPDGQMFFFTSNPLIFAEGDFYTIQDMAGLPPLPPGRTVIGNGYSLVATPGAPVMNGSISFEYLGSDVAAANGDEEALTVYFWNGSTWTPLPTRRDPYYNMVSALSQGAGVYVLMSSVEIPIEAAGWNLIAYPIKQTLPVADALRSLDGYYTQVLGYEATDRANPWRRYIVGLPPRLARKLNTLRELRFGRGYFLWATRPTTLYLPHDGTASLAAVDEEAAAALASMPQIAPATYFGLVQTGATFTPAAAMPVTARVNGVVCGAGQTEELDGQIIYAIEVAADEAGRSEGCGATGRTVTFEVGGQTLATTAAWNNQQARDLTLQADLRVYLPVVQR